MTIASMRSSNETHSSFAFIDKIDANNTQIERMDKTTAADVDGRMDEENVCVAKLTIYETNEPTDRRH